MMNQPDKSDNKSAQADLALRNRLASFDGFYDLVLRHGVRAVLREMQRLDLPAARILTDFLQARKDVLESMPSQLAPQLLRYLASESDPQIGQLVSGAAAWRGQPWLMPLGRSLDETAGAMLKSFQAHLDFVGALRILKKESQLISASEDGTIRFWPLSPEGELPLLTLDAHQGAVNDIVISGDGRRFFSASDDLTIRVWDLSTQTCLQVLEGHTDYVSALVLTADGRLVSASKDGTIRVWNAESGDGLAVLQGHDAWVSALALTPDDRWLVSTSINNRLKCWDMDTLQEAAPFFEFAGASHTRLMMGSVFYAPDNNGPVGHRQAASVLLVSHDGRTLVSGSTELILWDLESRQQKMRFQAHTDSIQDMVWLDDGRTLATAAQEIKIWDVARQACLQTFSGHLEEVTSLAFDAEHDWLISGSRDQTIKFWDLSKQTPQSLDQGHRQSVIDIRFSPDEKWAVSAAHDGQARIWNVETGACRHVLDQHTGKFVYIGGFSPDGEILVTTTSDSEVAVWDAATGALLRMLRYPERHFWPSGFVVLPSARQGLCSGMIQPIFIWDLDQEKAPTLLEGSYPHLLDAAVTAEGDHFAAVYYADIDQSSPAFMREQGNVASEAPLQWWDLRKQEILWEHFAEGEPAATGYFCRVILSPDEDLLVVGTSRGYLGIFDAHSGARLAWWLAHPEGFINKILWLENGQILTCGHEVIGLDANQKPLRHFFLRWWDQTTKACARSLELPDSEARTPEITQNGKAACYPVGSSVYLWDLGKDVITASYAGESKILFSAITQDGKKLVAGEKNGLVHVLRLVKSKESA